MKAGRRLAISLVSVILFLVVWHLAAHYVFNPMLVPPPERVVLTASGMVGTGELFRHMGISLVRVAVGFSVGTFLGILLGVPMGRMPSVEAFLGPVIQPMRFLSPTAMIPIAIVWFGIDEGSKYFLITYATLFIVLINTMAGVRQTPVIRIRAAQCMGATPLQVFLKVVVPSAVPYIIAGMRVALASAFMAIIPAEMLAAQSGLGYLLNQAGLLVQTDRIFVALALISLLGFLSDALFRSLNLRLFTRYMQEPLQ